MREKDRKCFPQPPVKIRLAPLPTRVNLGNSLNLEECLNRSVAMDRPLSRMSDLSNLSGNSIITTYSNFEHQSDELRRTLNRNSVIEALRMKDLKRRRVNYLNENSDNYSVDLPFNQIKRKRDAFEDEEEEDEELNSLFNKKTKSTKFARSNKLEIPSKNRFVSSQYKNNEILSSYFSINQPSSVANNQFLKNNQINNSTNNQTLANEFTASSPINQNKIPIDQDTNKIQLSESKPHMFKIPSITISNSSLKENQNASNNLSNSSISPIAKKTNNLTNSSSSDLLKSLNNSSTEQMSTDSLKEMDNFDIKIDKRNKEDPSLTKIKNKNLNSIPYKIPEHFHSIDEHIRDEKKARSRLGNFLKAIYDAAPSFMTSITNNSTTVSNAEVKTSNETKSNLLTNDNLLTTTNTTINFPSILNTKNELTKQNTTSTPLKVTFSLPNETKPSSSVSDLSSVFKFGQSTDQETKTKSDANSAIEANSSSKTPLFTFGNSNQPKDTKDKVKTNSQFVLQVSSSPLSADLSKPSNFQFNSSTTNQQLKTQESSTISKTPFATKLPTASNFNPVITTNASNFNPVITTNAATPTASSSIFSFSQQPTADTSKKDADKSFVFKFGSDPNSLPSKTNTNLNKSTVNTVPAFNFGQTSAINSNSKLNSSSSAFNFGINNNQSSLLKSTVNTTFSFGNSDLTKQPQNQILTSTNKSTGNVFGRNLDNSLTFKAPTSTAFNFNIPLNTDQINKSNNSVAANFSFGTNNSIKPKENNPLLSGLSNNSLTNNNAGFKFNLNPNLNATTTTPKPAFNFGSSIGNTSFNTSTQQQNTSTPFKFEPNTNTQAKPSFNFGSSSTNPPSTFNFSSSTSAPLFGLPNNNESSFKISSTATNSMFNIGRK